MAKVRVYELAKEFGVESKAVMDQLKEMGEFVRSASSTIEAPVVRRLKEAFSATAAPQDQQAARSRPAGPCVASEAATLANSWASAGGTLTSRRTRSVADARSAARSCAIVTRPRAG